MMMKTVVCLATIAIFSMNMAMAANYTVGGPNGGWDQSTDLTTWASSQTFLTGDNLIFTYTINHDVTEVSQADFISCSASNPLQPSDTGGLTVISLTSAGSRYFICSSAGHCLNGMKVEINTLSASSPPPATPPPSLPPPPTATPPVQSPPPTRSVHRPVASPPLKSMVPSPSPKHSPKVSPSSPPSKAAAPVSNPALPPASAPSQGGSSASPPALAPTSAARFSVMGALIASSGFFLMVFLNL